MTVFTLQVARKLEQNWRFVSASNWNLYLRNGTWNIRLDVEF